MAEELHFGRAAMRLGIAQPPLSQQIKQLERELGFSLLRRNSRSVALTESGRVFFEQAKSLLAQADQAVDLARGFEEGSRGHVKVGFVGSAALGIMPAVVKAFRHTYPDVELTPWEMTTTQQIKGLRDGQIELGFVRNTESPDITATLLLTEPIVVALPAEHPLATLAEIPAAALNGETFVAYTSGPGGSPSSAEFRPKVIQRAGALIGVLGLVASGIGITTVPESTAAHIQVTGVAFRPFVGQPLTIDLYLASRSTRLSPAAEAFRQFTLGAVEQLQTTRFAEHGK